MNRHVHPRVFKDGRGGGARTHDPLIKSQLLFQLSYASIKRLADTMTLLHMPCKLFFQIFSKSASALFATLEPSDKNITFWAAKRRQETSRGVAKRNPRNHKEIASSPERAAERHGHSAARSGLEKFWSRPGASLRLPPAVFCRRFVASGGNTPCGCNGFYLAATLPESHSRKGANGRPPGGPCARDIS